MTEEKTAPVEEQKDKVGEDVVTEQPAEAPIAPAPEAPVQEAPVANFTTPAETKKPEAVVETPPVETAPVEESEVVDEIAKDLSGGEVVEETKDSTSPVAKETNPIDLSNLSPEQIQELQEQLASQPRRKSKVEKYHTIQLRTIDGKIITRWGKTFQTFKQDPTLRKDVLKTIIPVYFNGEEKPVNILWKDEFMLAEMAVCRVVKMEKKEEEIATGDITYRRDDAGEQTAHEVEMYKTKVIITLTVLLPDGSEAVMDSAFAN